MKYKNFSKGEKTDTRTWMVNKSMRDLTGHSISVAVTPNVMSMGASVYPMLAQQNRIIDTRYAGQDNITGNIPVEVFNNPNSGFLYAFDLAQIRLAVKYNYLAIEPTDKNVAYNNECAKAMSEAIANAFAETFTDLPFFSYRITTGMPGQAAGMTYLAFATFYQTVLQNIIHVVNSYVTSLALEDTVKQQAWLREVPQLTQLYGLLKKASLKSLIEGIANYVPGSALDTTWTTQMNILTNIPCKRSDSYEDPLICVAPVTTVPDITVSIGEEGSAIRVFKYSETDNDSDYLVTVDSVPYSLTELVEAIVASFSPYNIQMWARQVYEGTSSVSARAYFDDLVKLLEGLMAKLARFPADTADFDVVLKVLQRAGLNNWNYGISLKTSATPYKPIFNKLLYDLVKARSAGGADMIYDSNTRRWKFFTLWDSVTDIPEYDMKSGGSFLTFSLRQLPSETSSSGYLTTKWLIPHLFSLTSLTPIVVGNRRGEEFAFGYTTLNATQIAAQPVFCRLKPISSTTDISLRVPTINVTGTGDVARMKASFALKLIMRIAGLGAVTENSVTHAALSPTIMCLVDEQIEDVSNAMINQARVSAPFRVAVGKDVRTIGFAGGI